MILLQSKAKL